MALRRSPAPAIRSNFLPHRRSAVPLTFHQQQKQHSDSRRGGGRARASAPGLCGSSPADGRPVRFLGDYTSRKPRARGRDRGRCRRPPPRGILGKVVLASVPAHEGVTTEGLTAHDSSGGGGGTRGGCWFVACIGWGWESLWL